MIELLKAVRVLGLRPMLRLSRARRLGWEGIISGFHTTRAMQALFNVGFFDEVQKQGVINVASFAKSKHLDARILQSLCDALFSLSILTKHGADYALDAKGKLLVEEARGWFDGVYGYEEIFHCLEALLTGEKAYGKDVKKRADFVAKGSEAIEQRLYFPLAIDIIARNGFKKVLDLGCGEGTFLRRLCENNPEMTGYGIDIAPDIIAYGKEHVVQAGLQQRIHLFVEDIARIEKLPEPWQCIDVATAFFILHELLFAGVDPVIELLQNFRTVFAGVPLIVFETIRPTPEEMRSKPRMGIQYFLQHDLSEQRPVSREEWRKLFKMAGCSSIEERYLRFARTAIFTLR